MNILIIGSGGREHAMGWKIEQSSRAGHLFFAPGNAGTALLGTNLDVEATDFLKIKSAVIENNIKLVVVGPEIPLVEGIANFFASDPQLNRVMIVGPKQEGALLEGSKDFAKQFMQRNNIPTAKYLTVSAGNLCEGLAFLETLAPPYVLKADGLAAGKGVLIVDSVNEARGLLNEILEGKFGEAGKKVVIEEFLAGVEVSVFVITDGKTYKLLPEAKDYKRIGEGDTGLNTGGMGAISPVPFVTPEFMNKIETRIISPTIAGLQKEQIEYSGFIFFGLINVSGEPYLIEYNARMGDPETEAVMLRIKSDFVDLLEGAATGTLHEKTIEIDPRAAATVMLVSGGYPGSYLKGEKITGIEKITGSIAFHAGTGTVNNSTVTSGGRVMAISSRGASMEEALAVSYKNAALVEYKGMYYRKDLGFDLKK